MAKEIERKFLVTNETYKQLATESHRIIQGYISRQKEGTVRIRLRDNQAFLTVKGANRGVIRDEWEYEIPINDAREMLRNVCHGNIIEKVRYIVPFNGLIWEVDCFTSPRQMTLAEIELPSPDSKFETPSFIGKEVSDDPAYYNSNL